MTMTSDKKCKTCGKFPFCKEAEKENCENWKRQSYEELRKIDNKISERTN